MAEIYELEILIKKMIDDLKGLCQTNGLANTASEEEIITSVFLYKFLNDKFIYHLQEFSEDTALRIEDILKNENSEMDAFYDSYPQDVAFTYDQTIEALVKKTASKDFHMLFDDALEAIAKNPKNEVFAVESADGTKKKLFDRLTEKVEPSKRYNFARNIFGIIAQEHFDFTGAFRNNFDFYSTIFEYLIKDYNVASGVYAEYFTPQAVSSIIAKILVHMSPVEDKFYEIYDPSAGSGSLVLHLANELGHGSFGEKAIVYTQDISAKSSRFLRLNMMLNGLTRSLGNIVEGDTLVKPAHYKVANDASTGNKLYDFITSNPPFKMDFSSTRDNIENIWADSEEHDGLRRFFAGVPKIPNKKKESMAIYLCFIQHILWFLKPEGKAAIVVPTGFITAQSGIEKKIREQLIKKHWLKGVVSMPSNIFANTGTNVSVLFIDKSNQEGKILLMDASKLGKKVKDGKNQRTVLSNEEIKQIEDTFIEQKEVEDFSVSVTYEQVAEKNYSFSAGQYFDVKIEYVELTQAEFSEKMAGYKANLAQYFADGKKLEEEIMKQVEGLKYE
ncbi:class I SAM-dependent DNA methyltransferase [uncultured Phascolarctobacterium sp.]|uniref:HsdM family class I SAM-dependent methyltransferase n=1 Tax=uncultured Phascolarctobacterium sp. TaxID=512296 RepID=UPI0025EE8E1F|nr:class I SAM-dependent DNA methyltransferase [uncultured Phascolarctobacterium sp.]